MDEQSKWDAEDAAQRMASVVRAQQQISDAEMEIGMLAAKRRALVRKLKELRWRLAEVIRVAARGGPR